MGVAASPLRPSFSVIFLNLSLGKKKRKKCGKRQTAEAEAFSQYREQAGQRCLRSPPGEKQSVTPGQLGFSPIQLEVCPGLARSARRPERRKPPAEHLDHEGPSRTGLFEVSARRLGPPHILRREMNLGG